jgi:hypothetical protein
MDLKEIGYEIVVWIYCAQDRLEWGASICIQDGEFVDQPSDYQLIKKNSVSWIYFLNNFILRKGGR